jgi:hypothetical protein
LQIVPSFVRNVSKSAQHQSQRTLRVLLRAIQSNLAKSAHLKSQREHLSQLEIVQQRLSSQPENVQRLSHSHVLQSSLQIALSAQSVHFVQSV